MGADAGRELLGDAFSVFRDASERLIHHYSMLERKVEDLNREIVEKNRAMERTRRLAAMGEMAAKIAHEIRNPLASIAIFSNLLERELEGDEEKRRLALHVTKGVKTLDNILSNMLLFAGGASASFRDVDVREVIEETLLISSGHSGAQVAVSTSFDSTAVIKGDEGLLRQLFLNIIINSFDAMKDGGSLTVRTRLRGVGGGGEGGRDYLDVEVRDTGSGIGEGHLDRVFDPFFSTKERGTGLGLAIVASIADAHNAAIALSSRPGEGTSFVISFPCGGVEGPDAGGVLDKKEVS